MEAMADAISATAASNAEQTGQPPADDGAKRRQIIDGARSVFFSDGFDGASMNDIAHAAGVSKGTLYAYFDSKEQLFETLVREDREQQAERLCAFPHDGGDPAALLGEFGRRLVEMIMRPDTVAQVRVVIAAAARFPNLGRAFFDAGPRYGIQRLAAQLERFVKAGKLDIADPERAARQFINLCCTDFHKEVLFGVIEATTPSVIDAAVDSAVAVFMKAYGPRPAAAPPPG
jgi:AcrR family transcriptional regulator